MTLSALWLRWRVGVIAGGVIVAAALGYLAHVRRVAVWQERAHVADSTARVEQRRRAENERRAADAILRDSLSRIAIARLTGEADRAAQEAFRATERARIATSSRDRAIAALAGAQGQDDSLRALVGKSLADDSLIAAQVGALAAWDAETVALRTALDTADAARRILVTALDSARAQLGRSGQVIQSLQASLRSARPTTGPRVTKLAVSAGVGVCASSSLEPKPCLGVVAGPSLRVF